MYAPQKAAIEQSENFLFLLPVLLEKKLQGCNFCPLNYENGTRIAKICRYYFRKFKNQYNPQAALFCGDAEGDAVPLLRFV